ncbi:hypothetical protein JCM9140_2272 [Halalkalibacter wakoensis JCM 9140]|uniref:CxxH/CxxC protein n=1 Tax=Halalkalibacter wakoensis JCM 9140 TaxID=1236970 RepID=W4Q3C8_9BACI|nr:CxxH/CxxC protein [Halalkalibacter wakoensis]GAE26233.1 hypothetical protein JCM9140_2272 [Halalkalibacter wakoensis JCM 9140]
MYFACNEHIELAIDMTVDEQEQAPIIEKVEQTNESLSTGCSFCEKAALYTVEP